MHQTGSRGGAKARRAGTQHSHGRLDGAAPVAASGRCAQCGKPGQGSTYLRTAIIRHAPRAVGLMEIEHLFRSTALAVGLKPPAMECEARLRGRERIISSKTICSDKRDLPTAQQSALITDGRRNGPRFTAPRCGATRSARRACWAAHLILTFTAYRRTTRIKDDIETS